MKRKNVKKKNLALSPIGIFSYYPVMTWLGFSANVRYSLKNICTLQGSIK